MVADARVG